MIVTILEDAQECACGNKKTEFIKLYISECPECHQIFCNHCFDYTENKNTVGCPKCGEELELPPLWYEKE